MKSNHPDPDMTRHQLEEQLLHDLAMLNFADELHADAPSACWALYEVLLDERLCRARIAWLQALGEAAVRMPGPELAAPERLDFADDIRTLVDVGASEALARGLLDLERLAALTRDPDALWAAHCAFKALDAGLDDDEAATAAGVGTSADAPSPGSPVSVAVPAAGVPSPPSGQKGITTLVVEQDWEAAREWLEPWMQPLLEQVGVQPDEARRLAGPLLEFLLEECDDLRGRRFRERLPEWLHRFAAEQGLQPVKRLTVVDWERMIGDRSWWDALVGRVAVGYAVGETRKRLERRHAQSLERLFAAAARARGVEDLRSLEAPVGPGAASDLPEIRRELAAAWEEGCERLRGVWELN